MNPLFAPNVFAFTRSSYGIFEALLSSLYCSLISTFDSYKNFKSIYLENISFEEQIKYFNNAKLIICAHGAGMSNMFFCKENKTKLIEITCGKRWEFFNVLSRELNIKHLKCHNNILGDIINFIDESYNSNPLSLKNALINFSKMNLSNRSSSYRFRYIFNF